MIEALKQVREAINKTKEYQLGCYPFINKAAKALDEAIAELESQYAERGQTKDILPNQRTEQEPPQRKLKSTTDMMMELADRLGELPDDIDPRAWSHLLVYAPEAQPPQRTEQEPVETYIHEYTSQPHPNDFGIPKGHWWEAKLYANALANLPAAQPAQPAQRKPLTIDECLRDFESWLHSQGQHAFLKAPEGSKNTFWDGRTEDRWLGWKAAHGIKENT